MSQISRFDPIFVTSIFSAFVTVGQVVTHFPVSAKFCIQVIFFFVLQEIRLSQRLFYVYVQEKRLSDISRFGFICVTRLCSVYLNS